MPLFLHPAVPSDLPDLIPVQFAAFHPTEPLFNLAYPSPSPPTSQVIERAIRKAEKAWDQTQNLTWLKVVDENGEIVAGAKWLFFNEEDEKRWEANPVADWVLDEERGKGNCGAGVEDREYVSWVFGEYWLRRRKGARGVAALLDSCFVSPAHQRRGAGRMLVEWGTKKADKLGIKCLVEASLVGKRLYEGCGFVVKEDIVIRGEEGREEWQTYGEVTYLWMEREARSVSG